MNFIFRIYKKSALKFWGFMYLIVIIIFGMAYWRIANKSAGQFFVFQNDINMRTKVDVFERNMKLNTHNEELGDSIKDLIVSKEYKRSIVKFQKEKGSKISIFTFDEPLGEAWANYYYHVFAQYGITHMKVDDYSEQVINNNKVYKVTISLYSFNRKANMDQYKLYKYSYIDKFKKMYTTYVFIKDYPFIQEELFNHDFTFYPLNFYFNHIMENSISFLDDSPVVLKEIVNGKFKYPLWNFLYFSTVTITTLGYGDILPGSTLVRTLVMIETVIGVVIIGLFVSCLFRRMDK